MLLKIMLCFSLGPDEKVILFNLGKYTNVVNYVHKLGTMLRLEYLSLQIIPDNECHDVYNIF
jgi:hypothetical protein